ncbi:MAG: hypothetical protein ABIJ56_06210 [Pseudomonadota bacterium]
MRRIPTIGYIGVLALVCRVQGVDAQPEDLSKHKSLIEIRYEQLVKEADTAFGLGQYGQAVIKYQQAENLYQVPDLQKKMALCYKQMGQLEKAGRLYRKYLERVSSLEDEKEIEAKVQAFVGPEEKAAEGGGLQKPEKQKPLALSKESYDVTKHKHGIELLLSGHMTSESWGVGSGASVLAGLHIFALKRILLRLALGYEWLGGKGRLGGGDAVIVELMLTVRQVRTVSNRLLFSAGAIIQYRYLWMDDTVNKSLYGLGLTFYLHYFFKPRVAAVVDFSGLPYYVVGGEDRTHGGDARFAGFEFILKAGFLFGL